MNFEHIKVFNFEGALRGMRNPKESWYLSNSAFGLADDKQTPWALNRVCDAWMNYDAENGISVETRREWLKKNGEIDRFGSLYQYAFIGPSDMKLAQQLIRAGSEHRKFMRQIFVCMDITAPLYWWKEADTYKVATVANSTSTMHTIQKHPITLNNFEIDDYMELIETEGGDNFKTFEYVLEKIIPALEELRQLYLKTGDKFYWKELIRWLPESWLQKRTFTCNYENLLGICSKSQRRFHKLNEWSGQDSPGLPNFVNTMRQLPYAQELLFIDEVPVNN